MRVWLTDKKGCTKRFFNSFLKWSHMITKILVNNGSDNGLLPHASKLLPEPMLTWGLPSTVSQKSLKTKLYADKTYRSKLNVDDLYASARRLRVINTCITLCLLHSDYNDMWDILVLRVWNDIFALKFGVIVVHWSGMAIVMAVCCHRVQTLVPFLVW